MLDLSERVDPDRHGLDVEDRHPRPRLVEGDLGEPAGIRVGGADGCHGSIVAPWSMTNGNVSFWWSQAGGPRPGRHSRATSTATSASSAAGSPGLWTAYWLAHHDPSLDIVVLEAEFAGFGASGRNGGWLSAELSGSKERYARTHGRAGVEALVTAMERAVDDVIGICRDEGIDADIVKSGVLYVARSPAQLVRMREGLADDARWGIGESHQRELDAEETADAGAGRGCARRGVLAARRAGATGPAGGGRRRGGGTPRRPDPRAHAGDPHRCRLGDHRPRNRARPRRAAMPRGLHGEHPRPAPDLAADELGDDRHRAAARRRVGGRSAGAGPSCWATARTPTATPSAPPTAASPSAVAASRTASARAPTPTAGRRTGRSSR